MIDQRARDYNDAQVKKGRLPSELLAWLERFDIRTFQLAAGVEVDGYVGDVTRRKAKYIVGEGWDPVAVIDLSHWNRLAESNQAFCSAAGVILKATQGTGYNDPTFNERALCALLERKPVGAYHFLTDAPGAAQADHFADTWERVAGEGRALLAPVLDVEKDGFDDAAPAELIMARAHDFTDRIEQRLGLVPVLYTYSSFWYYRLARGDLSRWDRLWLARYNRCLYEGKVGRAIRRAHGDQVIAWQWRGGSGQWPGVIGACDVNLMAPGGLDKWRIE